MLTPVTQRKLALVGELDIATSVVRGVWLVCPSNLLDRAETGFPLSRS
jgi:hypothetical protein